MGVAGLLGAVVISLANAITGKGVSDIIDWGYAYVTKDHNITFRPDRVAGCVAGNIVEYVRGAIAGGELDGYKFGEQKIYLERINVCATSGGTGVDLIETKDNPICQENDFEGRLCLFRLLATHFPKCFYFPSLQPSQQRQFMAILNGGGICAAPVEKVNGVWRHNDNDMFSMLFCNPDWEGDWRKPTNWSDQRFQTQPRHCQADELAMFGLPKDLASNN